MGISAESSGSAEAARPFAQVTNGLLVCPGERAIALVLLALATTGHVSSAALWQRASGDALPVLWPEFTFLTSPVMRTGA